MGGISILLHLVAANGDHIPLPDAQEISLSPVFCDYGAISFTYPKDGKRFASYLDGKDEIEVIPYINGVARSKAGGILQQIESDDVVESSVYKYTGRGYFSLLDEAIVYPFNWPSYSPTAPSWKVTNGTAGS